LEILASIALSLHLGMEGDYNSIHPHVRLQEQNYIAGAYYNSERNISPYVGYFFEHNEFKIELGAVGNYSGEHILPYVRANYKQFFITPGIEKNNIGIVIGIEVPFK